MNIPQPEPEKLNVFAIIADQKTPVTIALGLLYKGSQAWLTDTMSERACSEGQAAAMVSKFIQDELEKAHINKERLKALLAFASIAVHFQLPPAPPPQPLIITP